MNKYILEYIWMDSNNNFLSEIHINNNILDIHNKNIIKPFLICKDYFRKSNSFLVLSDVYDLNNNCLSSRESSDIFHQINYDKMQDDNKPYFIITQEYFFTPLNNNCKKIVEEHLHACLYSGLNISKVNLGSFNIGPCIGIDASDQLYMAQFILEKIAKKYNIYINYKIENTIYFSSFDTRNNGIINIYDYIKKLELNNSLNLLIKPNNSGYLEIKNNNNIDYYYLTSYIYKKCCLT